MEKFLTVCVDEDGIPSNFWWHHNLTFENFANTNPPLCKIDYPHLLEMLIPVRQDRDIFYLIIWKYKGSPVNQMLSISTL